jgi:hypothetical protein
MKKLLLALSLFASLGSLTKSQTAVTVNFNTGCKVNTNIGPSYLGIDFTSTPWDCELSTLTGNTTQFASWFGSTRSSGTFRFLTPSVLTSFWAASSGTNGMLTISSDAGETFSIAVVKGPGKTLATGFIKPASVITVKFPDWTLELDNLVYQTGAIVVPPPPPPMTVNFSIMGLPTTGCVLSGGTVTCTGATSPDKLLLTSNGTLSVSSVTITAPVVAPPPAHSASLSWTPSTSSVSTYRIYRTVTSGSYGAPLNSTATTLYVDPTVIAGNTYFYVVTAVDSSGNESLASNEVKGIIPTP